MIRRFFRQRGMTSARIPRILPQLCELDDRSLPATLTWTGASSNLWSTAANWSTNTIPNAGDDLVFPANASRTTIQNDLSGLNLKSITFTAGGAAKYTIGGNPITVGSIVDDSGNSQTINNNLVLPAAGATITVSKPASVMQLAGVISGGDSTKQLFIGGQGELSFVGTVPNTYSGTTVATGGSLSLASSGKDAIPGDLSAFGLVEILLDDQIADTATVTVFPDGLLDVVDFSERLGKLVIGQGTVTAKSIVSGNGLQVDDVEMNIGKLASEGEAILVITKTLTVNEAFQPATVSGKLVLPNFSPTFTVADGSAATDLVVNAVISGNNGFALAGAGRTLLTANNTHKGDTTIRAGTLVVEGTQSSAVILDGAKAVLAGKGQVGSVLDNAGTIAPAGNTGTAAVQLKVNGQSGISLSPAMTVSLNLRGASTDSIAVTGPVNLINPLLQTKLVNPPAGKLTLIDNDGTDAVSGTFKGLPEGAITNGYSISYKGGDGNDVVLTPAPLSVSIADTAVLEGNTGSTNATFTVTLNRASTTDLTVDFATSNGTATIAENDYTETKGTLTIAAGKTSGTISVPVLGDTIFENDELFNLAISNAVGEAGVTIAKSSATGTIGNDDTPPVITIADVTMVEGNTGTTNYTFTAKLSNLSALPVTADFATRDGTAKAGSDYTQLKGSFNFSGGNTEISFVVEVFGDTTPEPTEFFFVDLSNLVNATASGIAAQGTIEDDDQPQISVENVTVTENVADGKARFTVSLNKASSQTVTVNFATTAGTATKDVDYTSTNGLLTFNPGVTTQTVEVSITDDAMFELDETFNLVLSNAMNATLPSGKDIGIATITNDDARPTVSVASVSVAETKGAIAKFPVTLSTVSGVDTVVFFGIVDGKATAPDDYAVPTNTSVTIPAGQMTATVDVAIVNDPSQEADETFTIELFGADNADLDAAKAKATATILANDAPPTVQFSIPPASVLENSGKVSLGVTLSAASESDVTITFATADVSATAGQDYVAISNGTLTIPAGKTDGLIEIAILDDSMFENQEDFIVNITNAKNATPGSNINLSVRIIDNEPPPTLTISNASVLELAGVAKFTVTLSAVSSLETTFAIGFANGTAVAGTDFTVPTVTGIIPPGQTSFVFTVPIINDSVVESNETFTVTLSAPVNAAIADGKGQAIGTIRNDDTLISINDASVVEGNPGDNSFATFTISLSAPLETDVLVNATTVNGTAVGGFTGSDDYQPQNIDVRIAAGQTSATFAVTIRGDTTLETDENFTVELSNPSAGTLGDASGLGTIRNDDGIPTLSVADVSLAEDSAFQSKTGFTVSLSQVSALDVTFNYQLVEGTAFQFPRDRKVADYAAAQGVTTITIPAGLLSATVPVALLGDRIAEADETFGVIISDASGATISKNQATFTILNDDPTIRFAEGVTKFEFTEGNQGPNTTKQLRLVLDRPAAYDITIRAKSEDGTAKAGSDYIAIDKQITIPAGKQVAEVNVEIIGDSIGGPDETFFVQVILPDEMTEPATVTDLKATVTILNDDDLPFIRFGKFNTSFTEGDGKQTAIVELTAPSEGVVEVSYDDVKFGLVTVTGGKLSFEPGETKKSFDFFVNDDGNSDSTGPANNEAPVTASLRISGAVGARFIAPGNSPTVLIAVADNDPDSVPPPTFPTLAPIPSQFLRIGQSITIPLVYRRGNTNTDGVFPFGATSKNTQVIPNANLRFPGAGLSDVGVSIYGDQQLDGAAIQITATPNMVGSSEITVTGADNPFRGVSASQTFTLTVFDPSITSTALVGSDVGGSTAKLLEFNSPILTPFGNFTGGIRTATADFNLDGVADLVFGTGPGAKTQVIILDGKDSKTELFRVQPFEDRFTAGVFVATGDINGDGTPDLVISPDEGGGPRVDVYSGKGFATLTKLNSFLAIQDDKFRGGARPSIGDMNGDGAGDLIVSAGFGGGPRVAGFNGKSVSRGAQQPEKLFGDFFVFEEGLRNGAYVAVGDIDADGKADLVAGSGPGGGPRVRILSGFDLIGRPGGKANTEVQLANFFAGEDKSRGGVRVAVKDASADIRFDLITGDGHDVDLKAGVQNNRIRIYSGIRLSEPVPPIQATFENFEGALNGVFVG